MKKNTLFLNNKGITIVEMLIYMGILSIMLVVLTEMFVSILNLKAEMNAISYTEQDGRFILAKLKNDINNSQSITTPSSPGSIGQTLEIVKNGNNYVYTLNNGNLELTNNNGTFLLNSSETIIKDVSFKRIGTGSKDTIQLFYTVEGKTLKNGGRSESIKFQTTFGVR